MLPIGSVGIIAVNAIPFMDRANRLRR
jgi:hypothetical protein